MIGEGGERAELAWLVARARIADLIHLYAHAVRMRDHAAMAPLFADHAVFETREHDPVLDRDVQRSRVEGRAAVLDFVRRSITGPGAPPTPLIHNLVITVSGTTATSRCVMVGAEGFGTPRFMGVYQDEFREEDGWRFTSRVYTIVGWRP